MTDRLDSPVEHQPPAPLGGSHPKPPQRQDAPPAQASAAESAQAGKQAATEVAHTATDQAKEVAHEAKTQASNVVSEAGTKLRHQASDQQQSAAQNLRALGDELRSMSRSIPNGGLATDLVGQAADRVHGVAGWLDSRDPQQVLEELRSFARRRPGAFLAGALVAGVAAGRLTRGAVAAHSDDKQTAAGQDALTGAGPSTGRPS